MRVDIFTIKGNTIEDDKIILDTHKSGIEMTIDESSRIWNEGGQYIADGEVVESGFGIGCKTHGGKREGAGRKATGRIKKNIYVTEEEFESVKKHIQELRKEK